MFQVSCVYRGQGDVDVSDTATAAHLYRIVQEAVHNAVRHGQAANVAVDLVGAGERIVLTVEDDGIGIPDELPQQGMGLHTMSFRARMIGASLSVERGDGGGTVVTCSLRRPSQQSDGDPEGDYVEPRGAAI
jgi:signal transduction histidine kinase